MLRRLMTLVAPVAMRRSRAFRLRDVLAIDAILNIFFFRAGGKDRGGIRSRGFGLITYGFVYFSAKPRPWVVRGAGMVDVGGYCIAAHRILIADICGTPGISPASEIVG